MVKRTIEDLGHPYYHWDTSEYPTNAIPLDSLDSLADLEDNMVGSIKLDITNRQWNEWGCRTPLEQLIRPNGAYGEISDPYFAMMDNPFDEILEAIDDPDKSFIQGHVLYKRSLENQRFLESAQKCVGFEFLGQLKKQDHPISAQVWYINAPVRTVGMSASTRSNDRGGIIRIIAVPTEERESIQKTVRQRKINTAAVGACVSKLDGGKISKRSTLR